MILELKNVSKIFIKGDTPKEALNKINLNIKAPSSNLILGPSGAGKSTLISLISLLSQPTYGEIRINGVYTSALSKKESSQLRRQEIGIIQQRDNLFKFLNIEENVRVPQISGEKTKSGDLLRKIGIKEIDKCPGELSLLNQQIVALARALINNPSILLADEPTGELNSHETDEYMDILMYMTSESAVLVVSNNYRLKEYFDNIYYLNEGNLNNSSEY